MNKGEITITKYEYDFSNLFLPHSQYVLLKKIQNKEFEFSSEYEDLETLNMIETNWGVQTDKDDINKKMHISDKGKSYLIYRKEKFFYKKLYFILTIISLILSISNSIFILFRNIV